MKQNIENMTLKEKCYAYQHEYNYFLDEDKYIIIHIDGRCFSKLVKNKFDKPFDDNFIYIMDNTAKYLCEQVSGVQMAYVQSDEITLIIKRINPNGHVFFNGRLCKLQSIIASIATSKFNQLMTLYKIYQLSYHKDPLYTIEKYIESAPLYQFDCKAWNVDTLNDVIAWILFRNIDCVRNSKQELAQTFLSHKELQNLNSDEQIQLLDEKTSIDWHKLPYNKKYGRIILNKPKEMISDSGQQYIRNIWEITHGNDLTNQDNRINLFNELNSNML